MRSHVFHTKKFTCCIIKNINFSLLISIIVLAKVVLLYYFNLNDSGLLTQVSHQSEKTLARPQGLILARDPGTQFCSLTSNWAL